MHGRGGERGLTLVEVLVAGMIATTGLVAILHLTSTVLVATRVNGRLIQAALRADGLLARAVARESEAPRSRPDDGTEQSFAPSGGVSLRPHERGRYDTLEARVRWGRDRDFIVTTRRADRTLAAKRPSSPGETNDNR